MRIKKLKKGLVSLYLSSKDTATWARTRPFPNSKLGGKRVLVWLDPHTDNLEEILINGRVNNRIIDEPHELYCLASDSFLKSGRVWPKLSAEERSAL